MIIKYRIRYSRGGEILVTVGKQFVHSFLLWFLLRVNYYRFLVYPKIGRGKGSLRFSGFFASLVIASTNEDASNQIELTTRLVLRRRPLEGRGSINSSSNG
jgi:hypothetical protein